jgi:hypothetical protein
MQHYNVACSVWHGNGIVRRYWIACAVALRAFGLQIGKIALNKFGCLSHSQRLHQYPVRSCAKNVLSGTRRWGYSFNTPQAALVARRQAHKEFASLAIG